MNFKEMLMKFLALPDDYVDIVQTSDGHWLAQSRGDVGYNHFLGEPALEHDGPGKEYRQAFWRGLSYHDRKRLVRITQTAQLDLKKALRNMTLSE